MGSLGNFEKQDVNMTKIQSLPVIGKPYTFNFHADLEWKKDVDILQLIHHLKQVTEKLTILGIYERGLRAI